MCNISYGKRENVTLYDEKCDYVQDLEKQRFPGLSEWALNTFTMYPCQREMGNSGKDIKRGRRCEYRAEKNAATSQGMLTATGGWKRHVPDTPDYLLKLPERVQWNWFWTFDLHNPEKLNFCCFKPESFR